MAATQAMLGYNTRFFLESFVSPTDSPPKYVEMAEIKNVTPPNQQIDDVDVTHNTSPGRRREFIAGLIDPGEASFEMNFIPGSSSDQLINQLLTAGTQTNCKIIYPNLVFWEFLAIVKGYEISSATEEGMTATVTLKVTGDV